MTFSFLNGFSVNFGILPDSFKLLPDECTAVSSQPPCSYALGLPLPESAQGSFTQVESLMSQ